MVESAEDLESSADASVGVATENEQTARRLCAHRPDEAKARSAAAGLLAGKGGCGLGAAGLGARKHEDPDEDDHTGGELLFR